MENPNYNHIETGSDEWNIRQSQFEEFERVMWLDDSNFLKRSYPQHLNRGQSIACLRNQNGDICWGLYDSNTGTSEVYDLEGYHLETLKLEKLNGWVNPQNCISHGYTFLNLCEV